MTDDNRTSFTLHALFLLLIGAVSYQLTSTSLPSDGANRIAESIGGGLVPAALGWVTFAISKRKSAKPIMWGWIAGLIFIALTFVGAMGE